MKAILSNVHSNLEALNSVLADIALMEVDAIYNLGDIVGYGPDPIACIDLSMSMDVVLKGSFDAAVIKGPFAFCKYAEESIFWTRRLLEEPEIEPEAHQRRFDFLAGLPTFRAEGDVVFVHGGPGRDPNRLLNVNEFIFPEDIHNRPKMERIGRQFERICLNGHTGMPGLHIDCGAKGWQYQSASECPNGYQFDGRKTICNVGSVGQPRDEDWRASYVLFDGKTVTFRRVEYDIETTIKKIYANPQLADFSGDRLRKGS
jgi:diadenosine tetraphosphatase ApaH/serine/threonine PP2A family protein phosphatase